MGEKLNDFGSKIWKGFKNVAIGLAIFGGALYAGDYLLSNTVAGSELLQAGHEIVGNTHDAVTGIFS